MASNSSRYSIRFRKCDKELIEFAKMQSNFTDSIRYLIEKEIHQHGYRNLQAVIPTNRDVNFFYDNDGGNINE